jgi:hypothetical protein
MRAGVVLLTIAVALAAAPDPQRVLQAWLEAPVAFDESV